MCLFRSSDIEADIFSFQEFVNFIQEKEKILEEINKTNRQIISDKTDKFFLNGICQVCNREVNFHIDYEWAYMDRGTLIPNFRERLICPICQFNSRTRKSIHYFRNVLKPQKDCKIYITEQTTHLYNFLTKSYTDVTGSEYLKNEIRNGEINNNGIRNEDLSNLSFNNDTFDFILSFDCFEHIPDYKKAFKECYRCLKKNGVLFFTIPFYSFENKNVIRAKIIDDEIIHLLPPEYHGNPLCAEGSLCFHYFGWELLDEIRETGFNEVKAVFYWSKKYGHLGDLRPVFIANKI
jgi:hypothetical protein